MLCGQESSLYRLLGGRELTRDVKGSIAERAVHLRLEVCGFEVWENEREGAKADFGLISERGQMLRVHVK